MNKIIPFPISPHDPIERTLANISRLYREAGLSDEAASLALEEFEPILRDFIRPYKSELSLPLDIGLTPDQIAAIKEAHSECVQEIFQHYGHEMGMALATLAGVIGSKYRDNT